MRARSRSIALLTLLPVLALLSPACKSSDGAPPAAQDAGALDALDAAPQGDDFLSAPPGEGMPSAPGGLPPPLAPATPSHASITALVGDRLFVLDGHRGLVVVDVADHARPKILGLAGLLGTPISLTMHGDVAIVVFADVYALGDDGTPFYGTIARAIDVRDPASLKTLGEAKLDGWARAARLVGDVLYVFSTGPTWRFGAAEPGARTSYSLIALDARAGAMGPLTRLDLQAPTATIVFGDAGSILAVPVPADTTKPYGAQSARTDLRYVDTTDPAGRLIVHGAARVRGRLREGGPDGNLGTLDFVDGTHARFVGCDSPTCAADAGHALSVVDFTAVDTPIVAGELALPIDGLVPTIRLSSGYLYVAPNPVPGGAIAAAKLYVYDLRDPRKPLLAGTARLSGSAIDLVASAAGDRLFALCRDDATGTPTDQRLLDYLDLRDPASPFAIGTVPIDAPLGEGAASAPGFDELVVDAASSFVALPFSGFHDGAYDDGVRVVRFDASSIAPPIATKIGGFVDRLARIPGGLVALSDEALAVVDVGAAGAPHDAGETRLARRITALSAPPASDGVVLQAATDLRGLGASTELRAVPAAKVDETSDAIDAKSVAIDGVDPQIFRSGTLAYVVTQLRAETSCTRRAGSAIEQTTCTAWTQQVQVVDLSDVASKGLRLRGKVLLPSSTDAGLTRPASARAPFGADAWFDGEPVFQVDSRTLAIRRFVRDVTTSGAAMPRQAPLHDLWIVDLLDPDAPALSSVALVDDTRAWWGNLAVLPDGAGGSGLFATHFAYATRADGAATGASSGYYFLDAIDLTARATPKIASSLRVPGVTITTTPSDPQLLLTVDWRSGKGAGTSAVAEVMLVRRPSSLAAKGAPATLVAKVDVGAIGKPFVEAARVFATTSDSAGMRTAVIDLTHADAPVLRLAAAAVAPGWLYGVDGDRLAMPSGWGARGFDVYRVIDGVGLTLLDFVRAQERGAPPMIAIAGARWAAAAEWGVRAVP